MANEAVWRGEGESTAWRGGGQGYALGQPTLLHRGGDEPPLFVICRDEQPIRQQLQQALCRVGFNCAVYALCVEPRVGAYRSIQGLAAAALARIEALQPSGPYRVVGVREAGLIAYELGSLVIGRDEQMAFLGLVETECHARVPRIRHGGEEADVLVSLARDYEVTQSELEVHLLVANAVALHDWSSKLPDQQVHALQLAAADGWMSAVARTLASSATALSPLASAPEGQEGSAILLQQGAPGAQLLFCVPGAGAGVSDFLGLAGALGLGWQVHAFQARGMDGRRTPHSSVEAAARVHLRDLRRLYPRGEIHLVGHSFGGWVAFEMALQLHAEGRTVASLTLLDSMAPREAVADLTRAEALVRLGELYELAARRPLGISFPALRARDAMDQVAYLHACLVRARLISARSSAHSLQGPIRAFDAAIRTSYRPRANFAGVVELVLVSRSGEGEDEARARMECVAGAWRRYAPALRLRRVGGNHVSMLEAPHVERLACLVRESSLQCAGATQPAQWQLNGAAHSP